MSDVPQVTLHYFDGRESEVRDMTVEEIAQAEIDEQSPKQWQTDDLA